MKQQWKLVGLILALQFALSIGAVADEAATKKAMVAKYQLIQQAIQNVDSEILEKQLASNFVAKMSRKRTQNRAQFIASQRVLFDAIIEVHVATLRINKVTVGKNRAVVIVTQIYDLEVEDVQGRTHRLKEKSVCRDTWVQVSGQWKNTVYEFVSGSASIDGKNVPM